MAQRAYDAVFQILQGNNTLLTLRVDTDETEACLDTTLEHLAENLGVTFLYKDELTTDGVKR